MIMSLKKQKNPGWNEKHGKTRLTEKREDERWDDNHFYNLSKTFIISS